MKKQLRIIKKVKQIETQFFKKCPNGGYCINPFCMLGCVDE
jgi:hypothetical protein